MADIIVTGDFPGANPKGKGIVQQGPFDFSLYPMSEHKKESFRFETKVINTFSVEKKIRFCITWSCEEWAGLKDYLFMKGERYADWSIVPGEVDGDKTCVNLSVAPGETYVCLHPKYNHEDCDAFISKIQNVRARQYVAGTSSEGRNIRCIEITDPDIKKHSKIRVLVAARNHAYETSGSYCVEGMINWLLSEESLARYSLSKFIFYFLPMTNPDGVNNGLDRFTRVGGADLNRDRETNLQSQPGSLPDQSHDTFFRALDEIQPAVFLNLHSYNFKHKDEIYSRTMEEIQKFITFMPDQVDLGKVWKRTISEGKDKPEGYCREKFGSTAFLLEIPWFGRNGKTMRQTGSKIIRAIILMNTLQGDGWVEIGMVGKTGL